MCARNDVVDPLQQACHLEASFSATTGLNLLVRKGRLGHSGQPLPHRRSSCGVLVLLLPLARPDLLPNLLQRDRRFARYRSLRVNHTNASQQATRTQCALIRTRRLSSCSKHAASSRTSRRRRGSTFSSEGGSLGTGGSCPMHTRRLVKLLPLAPSDLVPVLPLQLLQRDRKSAPLRSLQATAQQVSSAHKTQPGRSHDAVDPFQPERSFCLSFLVAATLLFLLRERRLGNRRKALSHARSLDAALAWATEARPGETDGARVSSRDWTRTS